MGKLFELFANAREQRDCYVEICCVDGKNPTVSDSNGTKFVWVESKENPLSYGGYVPAPDNRYGIVIDGAPFAYSDFK